MSDLYTKVGNEYVFSLKDAEGNTFTAKAGIATDGPVLVKIGADTLALFPERSSNHKRIAALLGVQVEPAPK